MIKMGAYLYELVYCFCILDLEILRYYEWGLVEDWTVIWIFVGEHVGKVLFKQLERQNKLSSRHSPQASTSHLQRDATMSCICLPI